MKKLLIIAAVLIALPALVWAQADQTDNIATSITIAGTFALVVDVATCNFGSAVVPGTAVENPAPITANVKTNYDSTAWYLKIKDSAPLTRATEGTTIPNTSYFHRSSGGAGTHADAAQIAMTLLDVLFYTCTKAEQSSLPDGLNIDCDLRVEVPTDQREGVYSNTTTYTLTIAL